MNFSAPSPGERIRDVHVADDALCVGLADGRTITVPFGLVSSAVPRNSGATEQLESLCCRVWHSLAGHRRGPQLGRACFVGLRGGAPESAA